ncbi:hypothetical protein ANCDUO_13035 [Ancylostoma duodenale]|uniref:Uncharacterized protein n=1 Tax=Ancylostoma duodenale TaxID=51022 RepID=A0A0C2GI62_9BILA|nr:hypothetical protein ANCDUO_13035 [Ancylostoma duodenale]
MERPPHSGPPPRTDLVTVESCDTASSFSRVPAEFTTSSLVVDDTAMDTSQTPDVDSGVRAQFGSIQEISTTSVSMPITTILPHTEDYSVIDMDTSTTPSSSPSRVPADSYLISNQQHLHLSEEALLALDDDSPHVRSLAETFVASFPLTPLKLIVSSDDASASEAACAVPTDQQTQLTSTLEAQPMVASQTPAYSAGDTCETTQETLPDEESQWVTVQRKGFSCKTRKPSPPQCANVPSLADVGPRRGHHEQLESHEAIRLDRNLRGRGASRGRGGPANQGDCVAPTNPRGRGRGVYSGRPQRGRGTKRGHPSRGRPAPPRGNALPKFTPRSYRNYLSDLHPWASFVSPRPIQVLRENVGQVKNVLPTSEYRHLPNSGYLSERFNRSFFPRARVQHNHPLARIPFVELQHIEDAIAFRQRSARIINQILEGSYATADLGNIAKSPDLLLY